MGVKTFIVSWITFMDTIPEIRIFNVLPDFLPSLFCMLSDSKKEVSASAEKCLNEFLIEIKYQFKDLTYEIEYKILEILIEQSKTEKDSIKLKSFEWIEAFLIQYNELLLVKTTITTTCNKETKLYMDSTNVSPNYKNIGAFNNNFEITLKNTAERFDLMNNCNNENEEQEQLFKLPFNLFPKILEIILLSVNNKNNNIDKISTVVNIYKLCLG